MKKLSLKRFFLSKNINKIIVFVVTFIFIYFLLATGLTAKRYSLKVGDIPKVDIKAPREVKDELSTDAKLQQAVDSVPIQYNKNPEVKTNILNNLNGFFTKANQLKDSQIEDKDKLEKLKSEYNMNITDDTYKVVIALDKDDMKKLQDFLQKTLGDIYDDSNISDDTQSDNQDDIKKAQENILLKVTTSDLSKELRALATNIAYSQISPNFFYDKEKTEELRKEAEKKVSPAMIKKDQTIVKEGEPVTEHQIQILKDLGLLDNSPYFQWHIYLALAVLVILVLLLQWIYIYKYHEKVFGDVKLIIMINILNCIAILLSRIVGMISPFLMPITFIPMIMALLVNHRISLTLSVLNCVLINVALGFNLDITILAIVNSVVGAIILKKMQQRNDILIVSLYVFIINITLTFSIGFLLSSNVLDVVQKSIYTGSASIVSGILVIGFLPLFESVFDIVTTIKLLELSNPNAPLLKRLLMEAPGTYHHSIMVGNLAEVAAEEVGGNSLLARVAAYYHDIGKIKRPYFFRENQLGKDNPHDKLTPNLSTLIIISHVKDGSEMAKEYKLPKIIRDIIEEHHGTSIVKYFYLTMKNSSEKIENVNEDDFKYSGPIPKTKESGIIMLADGVEAAVRSINEPDEFKITQMIDNIFKDRLNEGQLDDCDLTLRDISKIKKAFLTVLIGIYHHRIEYPEDKFSKKHVEQLQKFNVLKQGGKE
ncbi:HD family phosphohydrolase [Clostridium kluyveri]|uniref:Phosphohydrolase n=1 Tax=Clostridium kluyveri TaxID=1534 RepID=A0A1L5F634_CLOKL|nr:HD family phosphohydrolase [Clostridium kluyveri]APM38290.1 phosphohydrolase [Clostridium kluyveri]UZQ51699.1 HD family phosphohydrolase [Clostridium kluyveri]